MAEKTGMTPQALLNKPQLSPDLQFSWHAFEDLHMDREIGMNGPLGIRLRDFLEYTKFNDYTRADAQRVWNHVQWIDREWRRLRAERLPKST